MATVTGFTAERMQEIEDATLVSAEVVDGDLIFTRHNETTFNAGSVEGPEGPVGPTSIEKVTHATRPGSPAAHDMIYETDTGRVFVWTGAVWRWLSGNPMRCRVGLNVDQSISHNSLETIVWERQDYDTDGIWTPGGTADSFIIPTEGAGVWRFTLNGTFAINSVGARLLSILLNDDGQAGFNSSGSAAWLIGGSTTVDLNVDDGDIITAAVYQASGGNLDLSPSSQVSFSALKLT